MSGIASLLQKVLNLPKHINNNKSKMSVIPQDAEALIHSDDPHHPANHICTLCAHFYTLGWVCGEGVDEAG